MDVTGADGGTLYLRHRADGGDELVFKIMITRSLGVHEGGTSDTPASLPPIPLYDEAGHPNMRMVAARAAVTAETVNIPDAYAAEGFDLEGTRAFDATTGYRSESFLTVPMQDHEDQVIGVLQLINRRRNGASENHPFDADDQQVAESLASQAAIALTKKRLIEDQQRLFEAFIELIAETIDKKSPHTGGHCRRVPELTLLLADAAHAAEEGPHASFRMTDGDRDELRIASWLHDCGKLATPEHIVSKSTKLETICDRIELVRTRYEILRRDVEIRILREHLPDLPVEAEARIRAAQEVNDGEVAFLEQCNRGAESMPKAAQERVRQLASRPWTATEGTQRTLLTDDEIENLTVARGTLTAAERTAINDHIVTTIDMLESLPYPRHLERIPEIAGNHHERMDGKGYPRGLTREQMTLEARMMGLADVFESLTARDRPYKDPNRLSEALAILGRMAENGHVDPELFDLFVREKLYLRYAEAFLEKEQIDEVDPATLPGYTSTSVSRGRLAS